jgi:hypothetical protein
MSGRFLPVLGGMMSSGLITIEKVGVPALPLRSKSLKCSTNHYRSAMSSGGSLMDISRPASLAVGTEYHHPAFYYPTLTGDLYPPGRIRGEASAQVPRQQECLQNML